MAFVVLDYHFNLRKIFRDLERNGIQNAICPPGVKVLDLVLSFLLSGVEKVRLITCGP